MPAPMELPMATAMPNHIPSTCNSFPWPLVAPADVAIVLVEDSADVLDNVSLRSVAEPRHHNGGTPKCKLEVTALQ
jgi:hypothetical protein